MWDGLFASMYGKHILYREDSAQTAKSIVLKLIRDSALSSFGPVTVVKTHTQQWKPHQLTQVTSYETAFHHLSELLSGQRQTLWPLREINLISQWSHGILTWQTLDCTRIQLQLLVTPPGPYEGYSRRTTLIQNSTFISISKQVQFTLDSLTLSSVNKKTGVVRKSYQMCQTYQ